MGDIVVPLLRKRDSIVAPEMWQLFISDR